VAQSSFALRSDNSREALSFRAKKLFTDDRVVISEHYSNAQLKMKRKFASLLIFCAFLTVFLIAQLNSSRKAGRGELLSEF
jgi:uncharacterized protein (DUF486 family)